MVLLQLFLSYLRIGLFAIGGAYSFLPLIEKEIVEKYHWISKEEFLDIVGVVKIFPGAISIKFATYTGYKIGGIPGVLAANAGNLLAPVILVMIATAFYLKHKDAPTVKSAFSAIQFVVFAMIISAAFNIIQLNELLQLKNAAIAIAAFCLFMFTDIHPAFIIITAGIIGFCAAL